jgi:hypothetical protein
MKIFTANCHTATRFLATIVIRLKIFCRHWHYAKNFSVQHIFQEFLVAEQFGMSVAAKGQFFLSYFGK